MHVDEIEVDYSVARALVDEFAQYRGLTMYRIAAWGTDHVIFRLGDDLAVRFPKIGWARDQARVTHALLPRVAAVLDVAVPTPIAVGEPTAEYPYAWSIVPWLDGTPLVGDRGDRGGVAEDLARAVRQLHSVDTTGAPLAVGRGGTLAEADAVVRSAANQLRSDASIDVDALVAVWAAGVDCEPYAGPKCLVHRDLSDGNVLLIDGRLSGIIDWGSLAIGDPAVELMIAWHGFDAAARAAYRDALGFVDDAMWTRGRAWAAAAAIQALPYYRDTNPDIVARSLRTIAAVLDT